MGRRRGGVIATMVLVGVVVILALIIAAGAVVDRLETIVDKMDRE